MEGTVMRHVFATLASIGVALIFLGTVGLVGKGATSIGIVREVKEVFYGRCFAMVEYTDVYGGHKAAVLEVACPCQEKYTGIIPLRYSLLNTYMVEEGEPFYPWEIAVGAYKMGMVLLVAGLPFLVTERKGPEKKHINELPLVPDVHVP